VVRIEWDPDKAAANLAKHGVSFEQASELFTSGVDFLEIFDEAHSLVEERFWAIGRIRRGLVVVVYTEIDEDTVRIISARMATARERALYRARMEER
jgi:uncharacterized DUF497 family protein